VHYVLELDIHVAHNAAHWEQFVPPSTKYPAEHSKEQVPYSDVK